MTKTLEQKIKRAPVQPGVYRFLDAKGAAIYIGKAGNLKARLRSYITAGKMGGKVQMMLEEAKNVRWLICGSDIEALIMESALIKKHLPKWNVVLRDDKSYFFVHITDETFPRIYLTHQPKASGRFIGPFTEGRPLKATLHLLREIFPYCTCSQAHVRACLNSQIGKCPGYCCRKIKNKISKIKDKIEYRKNIENIIKVLKGQTKPLVAEMKKKMKAEAKKRNFEEAAKLRDRIQALESIFKHRMIVGEHVLKVRQATEEKTELGGLLAALLKRKKPIASVEMIDVANIQGIWAVGGLVRFENGKPNKNGYRLFKIKGEWKPNDPRMIAEVVRRRLRHPEWKLPQLLIVDGGITQFNAAEEILENQKLRNKENGKLLLASLAKPHGELFLSSSKKYSLVQLPTLLRHFLERISKEAHRFTNAYYRKLHRKSYRVVRYKV